MRLKSTNFLDFASALFSRLILIRSFHLLRITDPTKMGRFGRSLAYRFGVFQLLSQISLMNQLPEELNPGQVRCALSTVIQKMIDAPGTLDQDGW